MASSGFILKKRGDIEFKALISDINQAARRAGLESRIDPHVHELCDEIYMWGNIANSYEDIPEAQQWGMYLYVNDKDTHRFDHVIKNGNLVRVIVIERISDCEKILLDFLFEFFKLNPEDYFWTEGVKWHYTYEDIVKIKQKPFDPNWCYKDPHIDD